MDALTTNEAALLSTALVKRAMDGQASPSVPTFGLGTVRLITARLNLIPPAQREQVAREALAHMVSALAAITDMVGGEGNE